MAKITTWKLGNCDFSRNEKIEAVDVATADAAFLEPTAS